MYNPLLTVSTQYRISKISKRVTVENILTLTLTLLQCIMYNPLLTVSTQYRISKISKRVTVENILTLTLTLTLLQCIMYNPLLTVSTQYRISKRVTVENILEEGKKYPDQKVKFWGNVILVFCKFLQSRRAYNSVAF